MTKKELAKLLGISGAMVTKHSKMGMPTDSLERAQRWRNRHLEPGRMKGVRYDGNYKPRLRAQPVQPVSVGACLSLAAGLLDVASMALSAGGCIDALIPGIRHALAAVPVRERGGVLLPLEVMNILVADVYSVCAGMGAESTAGDAAPMSDAEATAMGEFWYQVAAGEWRVT